VYHFRIETMRYFGALVPMVVAAVLMQGCVRLDACVAEGTLIATPRGPRPVESLRAGDQVWARGVANATGTATVRAVGVSFARRTLLIELEGDQALEVTPEHPVMAGGRWRRAGSLRPGDPVSLESGEGRVARVSGDGGPATVYDLTVQPHGTFIANGVVVHNKRFPLRPTADELAGPWVGLSMGGTVYSLVLRADGTGALSALDGRGEAPRKGPVSWKLRKYRIEIDGEEGAYSIRWEGTAIRDRLRLRPMKRPSVASDRYDVVFRREADLDAEIESLRADPGDDGTDEPAP
jgi:hypothetical protein